MSSKKAEVVHCIHCSRPIGITNKKRSRSRKRCVSCRRKAKKVKEGEYQID